MRVDTFTFTMHEAAYATTARGAVNHPPRIVVDAWCGASRYVEAVVLTAGTGCFTVRIGHELPFDDCVLVLEVLAMLTQREQWVGKQTIHRDRLAAWVKQNGSSVHAPE